MKTHYGIVNELLTFDVEVELQDGASMDQVEDAITKAHTNGLSVQRHRTRIFHPVGIKGANLPETAPTTVEPSDRR